MPEEAVRFILFRTGLRSVSFAQSPRSAGFTQSPRSSLALLAVYPWLEERLEGFIQHVGAGKAAGAGLSLFVESHAQPARGQERGFLFQFVTGAGLTLFYRPTVMDSFLGALAAGFDFAWLLRCFHRLSSNFLLLLLAAHATRVFFTGGHLRPRELTWTSGLALTALTSAFGASGYTIPWDQVGFWAYQVVSAIPASLDALLPQPLPGAAGAFLGPGAVLVGALRGGPALGQLALSRCFAAHTLLLPAALLAALAAHFVLIRKQGISGPL